MTKYSGIIHWRDIGLNSLERWGRPFGLFSPYPLHLNRTWHGEREFKITAHYTNKSPSYTIRQS